MLSRIEEVVSIFGTDYVLLACVFAVCMLLVALPRMVESLVSLFCYILGLATAFCVFLLVHLLSIFDKNSKEKMKEEANIFEQLVRAVSKETHSETVSVNEGCVKDNSGEAKTKNIMIVEYICSWLKKISRIP